MTVAHFKQVGQDGQEKITAYMPNEEEKEMMRWLNEMEEACSGVVIFIHQQSDAGFHLCSVPSAHEALVTEGSCPPRYCGCENCFAHRVAIRELTAWNISPTARELAMENYQRHQAMREVMGDGRDTTGSR